MSRKTPPFPEYPAWTESRFFQFLRSALRQAWNRWPPKYQALKEARRNKPEGVAGRHRYEYHCSSCGGWFKSKEVQVDHLIDAGSLKSFEDLPGFASRLFVGVDKLQVLCKPCHRRITKERKK